MENEIILYDNIITFPKISVIVACLNEERFIEHCLASLVKQDYHGIFDIIISDGGSTDSTREIVNSLIINHSNIKLIDNPGRYQSIGRNTAVSQCSSEFFAYLDAHRFAHKSWLSELWNCYYENSLKDEHIAGVGSIHLDAANTDFSKAQEIAFQSILSGASSANFLNYREAAKVDHACMCLYKTKLFVEFGSYNPELQIGEDIELNHRITYIYGYNLYLNPNAVNYYYPRENFKDLFIQQFNYGFWRQKVIKLLDSYKKSDENKVNHKKNPFIGMKLKTLVPGLFVGYVVLMFILSLAYVSLFYIFCASILLYLITISISSIIIGHLKRINPTILIFVFVAIHFGYGSGVLNYILRPKSI